MDEFRAELAQREVRLHEFQEQEHSKLQTKQENKVGVKGLEVNLGDYVMVQVNTKTTYQSKLGKRWIGPARVVAFDKDSPQTLTVEYLCPSSTRKKNEIVHARRVKFFDLAGLAITDEIRAHAEMTAQNKYVVRTI